MNQVYKVVWNVMSGTWTAVSEIAKGKGKKTVKLAGGVCTLSLITFSVSALADNAYLSVNSCTPSEQAIATGSKAIALGCDAQATNADSIAIGNDSNAPTKYSIALGALASTANANSANNQSIAIGYYARAAGDQSVALGANTFSEGDSSVAIGGDDLDRVANANNVAIGARQDRLKLSAAEKEQLNLKANNSEAAKIFRDLTGQHLVNFALDENLPSQYTGTKAGNGAVSVGVQATAADLATAFGTRSTASGKTSVALGVASQADKDGAVAIGAGSKTDANATEETSAVVNGVTLSGFAGTIGGKEGRQVSVGSIGYERQIKNVAPGQISAVSTDAINGSQLFATTTQLIQEGFALQAQDGNSVQKNLGQAVEVVGADANISTKVDNGQVQIELAKDLKVNSVAAGNTIVDVNGLSFNTAAGAKKGPSITATGINAGDYKVTQVASGDINAQSTDAINGSQLHAVQEDVKNIITTGLAGVQKKFLVSSNGQEELEIHDNAVLDIGTAADEKNLKVSKNLNTIDFSLNKDLDLDSAKFGSTLISDEGVNFKDAEGKNIGPSITKNGLNAGNLKVTNVANGDVSSTSTDAVNGSQLYQVEQKIGNAQGNISTAQDTANTALATANKGFALKAQDGSIVQKSLGEAVDVVGADANISTKVDNGQVQIELAKDLKVNSVVAGNSTLNNDGLTIKDGPSVTAKGIDAGNKVIANVANGEVSSTSKDAVNGSQLYQVEQKIGNVQGNVSAAQDTANTALATANKGFALKAQDGSIVQKSLGEAVDVVGADTNISTKVDNGQVQIELAKDLKVNSVVAGNSTLNNDGLTIKDGPSVTAKGIDAANKTIENVAAGKKSTDAVNVSQLNQTVQYLGGGAGYDNITQSFNAPTYQVANQEHRDVGSALNALDNANQALNQKVDNLGDQLQQAFYDSNKRIDDVEKRANAGIAAAMALETAPYIAGKYTYAAGAAYHGGENAFGLTLRKTADNGRWSLTGGVAAGSVGSPSVRVGISGVID